MNITEKALKLLNESGNEQYTVVLIGGSVGGKPISSVGQLKGQSVVDSDNLFDDKAEAKSKAKSLNKNLSPGEKKYYRMSYKVATVVNGKYTGK